MQKEFKARQGEIQLKAKFLSELGLLRPDKSSEITFCSDQTDL